MKLIQSSETRKKRLATLLFITVLLIVWTALPWILLLMISIFVIYYLLLPSEVPIHFNIYGEADVWGSKNHLFIIEFAFLNTSLSENGRPNKSLNLKPIATNNSKFSILSK